MYRVALHTTGCKVNFTETSTIGKQFVDHGFTLVEFNQTADIYVLNTCGVTERAVRECRQLIRRVRRNFPDAFFAVVGCYAQLQPHEIASIEGVDLILGTNEKLKIFEYIDTFSKNVHPKIFVSKLSEDFEFTPAVSSEVSGRTRAYVKIQDGCDYDCTFCTVPLARGKSRSQSVDSVIRQMEQLSKAGYKEVVLTGVNIGDYGKQQNIPLLILLEQLEKVDGIRRIRLSSLEPDLITDDVISLILRSEKYCNHFHIPLQSGSDSILKSMNRRYLTDQYRRIILAIKKMDCDAGIGIDIIAGFPGETDKLFEETYSFLLELPISYLHVFTYSERDSTPAVNFNGAVEPNIRFERARKLRLLGQKKKREFYSSFIGRDMPVLFESKNKNGVYSGFTTNYIRVECVNKDNLANILKNVQIIGLTGDVCTGVLKNNALLSK